MPAKSASPVASLIGAFLRQHGDQVVHAGKLIVADMVSAAVTTGAREVSAHIGSLKDKFDRFADSVTSDPPPATENSANAEVVSDPPKPKKRPRQAKKARSTSKSR